MLAAVWCFFQENIRLLDVGRWFVGWLVGRCWLFGWLVGWLVVGWLVGWLVGAAPASGIGEDLVGVDGVRRACGLGEDVLVHESVK